jgi:hypothetical protein
MNKIVSNKLWALLCIVALISLVGCGETESDDGTSENNDANQSNENPQPEGIEIAGVWDNQFGGVEEITDDSWDMGYLVQSIEVYDNDERFAITKNPDDAEYDPGKYNTIVWTAVVADVFHYCTIAFGLDTADDALNADNNADPGDLDGQGCGGFPWSKLTRQ